MKKMHKKVTSLLILLMVIFTTLFGSLEPAIFSAGENETAIHISTPEDLFALAKNCSLDSWSTDKTVILDADISFKDMEYEPIPYFNGTFDGNGHKITDVVIEGKVYPAGLIGIIGENGVIENLTVEATIIPTGEESAVGGIAGSNRGIIRNCNFNGVISGESYIGGIVGINEMTGRIESCTAEGTVQGEYSTGGIAGKNSGVIDSCINRAMVNTVSVDTTLSLEDLNADLVQDIYKLNSSDTTNSTSDTGGIAGYSEGMILGSSNEQTIGYPHVGYNVGGIAGRSNGYVQNCKNTAEIYGRKDVGGILGQADPFVDMEVTETDVVIVEAELKTLNKMVSTANKHAKNSSDSINGGLDRMSDHIEAASAAVKDLKTLEPNKEMGRTIKNSLITISNSLKGIAQENRNISAEMKNGGETLSEDADKINNQITVVSNAMIQLLDNSKALSLDDVVQDVSDQDIESITYGRVTESTNEGSVEGDINIGGIVGVMSVEYESDPEDEFVSEITLEEKTTYYYRAVVDHCTNKGAVKSKKDGAGGICGMTNLGIITDCQSFGSVSSTNGDYVGGIAGVSRTTIRSSYAKCVLSGNNYVGGIVGSGMEDEDYGSVTENCYALVDIRKAEQFYGAIAGCTDGTYTGNYFVSETLAGINRVSYAGKAEPMDYETFIALEGMPEQFKSFTLSFAAQDEVVKSIEFHYGDSFEADIFPEVPLKDGCSGIWDKTELKNLYFDTVVTAVYENYITAIRSENTRENGKSILLVEGNFDDEAAVTITEAEDMADISEVGYKGFFTKGEVVEQWVVSFTEDGEESHTIRFLADEDVEYYVIFIKTFVGWKQIEVEEIGSYCAFTLAGNEFEMVVVEMTTAYWLIGLVCGIAALIVLIILIVIIVKIYRSRKNRKDIQEPEDIHGSGENRE